MPVDLNKLTEGWLELESDPGLFTLLLEDFGVKGIQVEEIYDLQKPIEGPVFGFIFLFKWIEERRCRRKVVITEESFVEDEVTVNSIFFAQQVVPNSCATHALLSVLLNCSKIHLGPTLTRLKEHTKNMSPENKGYAIGNTPELARAHNSHAKAEPRHLQEKSVGIPTGRTIEAFHFVSYVPIDGRLFELDGLKPYPIDHGPCSEGEDWTEKFQRVITERLGIATGGEPYHDIRFNLMAVVADRRIAYEQKLRTLKTNRQIVLEALQQLVKLTHPELTSDDHAEYLAAVNDEKSSNTNRDLVLSECVQPVPDLSTPVKLRPAQQNETSPFPKLPPALDSHNYAKSPMMEGVGNVPSQLRPRYEDLSGSDYSDNEGDVMEIDISNSQNENVAENFLVEREPPSMKTLSINTRAELMRPLTIQTKFQASPTPSASSTDTSSEAGSAFNSPVRSANLGSTQNSPSSLCKGKGPESHVFEDMKDIKRFVVIRVTGSDNCVHKSEEGFCEDIAESKKRQRESCPQTSISNIGEKSIAQKKRSVVKEMGDQASIDENCSKIDETTKVRSEVDNADEQGDFIIGSKSIKDDRRNKIHGKSKQNLHLEEPHQFAPKDLLALLKTVEGEIKVCENNLKDEIEKRKKYKVDDCRRTHNYDQFICTFLSMLAEKGNLADIIEQQSLIKKRQGSSSDHHKIKKKVDRRRKTRQKKRK